MALFEKEMVVVDDDSANRLSSFHSDVLVNAPVLLMMTSPPTRWWSCFCIWIRSSAKCRLHNQTYGDGSILPQVSTILKIASIILHFFCCIFYGEDCFYALASRITLNRFSLSFSLSLWNRSITQIVNTSSRMTEFWFAKSVWRTIRISRAGRECKPPDSWRTDGSASKSSSHPSSFTNPSTRPSSKAKAASWSVRRPANLIRFTLGSIAITKISTSIAKGKHHPFVYSFCFWIDLSFCGSYDIHGPIRKRKWLSSTWYRIFVIRLTCLCVYPRDLLSLSLFQQNRIVKMRFGFCVSVDSRWEIMATWLSHKEISFSFITGFFLIHRLAPGGWPC